MKGEELVMGSDPLSIGCDLELGNSLEGPNLLLSL